MALDSYVNAGFGTLSTGIDASATSVVLTAGHGARFPNPTGSVQPFNAIIWNATDYTNPLDDPNYEIVRCTARSTDTLTVTRAQEGTTGVTHNTSAKTYKIALPLTLLGIQKLASGLGDFAGTDTGAANAYVTTISTYAGTLTTGMTVSFVPANTNSTASTLNHNGFGAVNIYDRNGSALVGGEIAAGQLVKVQYDGTQWRLTSSALPPSVTFLSATSSEKSIGSDDDWMQMTGNSITLTAGTWIVNGVVEFGNGGTSPDYTSVDYVVSTANGADDSNKPTAVSTTGNVTLKAGLPTPTYDIFFTNASENISQYTHTIEPLAIAVSASTAIYLVPFANCGGTATNGRAITNIWAYKISTATS
jgi:hypothetical protein